MVRSRLDGGEEVFYLVEEIGCHIEYMMLSLVRIVVFGEI